MKTKLLAALCLPIMFATALSAQVRTWSLQECIDYARDNNITVKQQQLTIAGEKLSLNTAQWARVPSLDGSASSSMSFGRGQSRDGTYQDNTQLSGSMGLSTSVPIFNGMNINNSIKSAKLDLQIALSDYNTACESVELNITSLFLQVLYYKELVAVAERQAALSAEQTKRSRELFTAGRAAESTVYESEALAASDEVTLTQQRNSLMLALLDLSQALNLDQTEGFDITSPDTEGFELIAPNLLPTMESVYQHSLDYRPQMQTQRLKLDKSHLQYKMAKAQLLPSLNASAGYNSSAYHSFANGAQNSAFWEQIRNNAYGYAGISLSVPIFNRRQTANQIKSAAIAIASQQLAMTETERTLRKEIEQAYYGAVAAYSKYQASDKAMQSASKAFDYEQEKMNEGRSTIFDFNDAKTRLEKAESDCAQAKYEFIFRRRILDFYAQ